MHQQRMGALLLHSFHYIILPFLFVFSVNAAGVPTNLPRSQEIDLTIKCGECLCINSCTQENPPPVPSPPPPVPSTEQCPPATTNQAPPPPPRFVYFTDPLDHPTLNPPPPPPPRFTYVAPPGNSSNRIPPLPPPPRFIYVSEPTTDPYSLGIYSMATITSPEWSFFLVVGGGLLAGIMFF